MERIFNFAAGPSMLPLEVLEEAQRDLISYKGCGMSVMEMSHRSKQYQAIFDETEATLRRIMNISDDYAVMFLQGGASLQFSMIPMNLMPKGGTANYCETGVFAKKAAAEAKKWGNVVTITSGKDNNYSSIPHLTDDLVTDDASYVHITQNNTIFGTTYHYTPDIKKCPLVADMSSVILGEEFDVNKYGLIYAGAQKNMAPAGMTLVIVKKDLLGNAPADIPSMLDYKLMADNGSMYNTPPCWTIYMAGLVYKWVEKIGGVKALEKRNKEKSALLYDAIDSSKLFTAAAAPESRSYMNVTFTLPTDELTAEFLDFVKDRNMTNLKGHRAVGGMRASIYNAMPIEGVQALVNAIKEFEAKK